MKSAFTLLTFFLITLFANAQSAPTYFWRNSAGGGNWNDANHWWNGAPNLPTGAEELKFDNNNQTSMDNNLPSTNRHLITFDAAASNSRTIGGATKNTFYEFYDVAGTYNRKPKIENYSTVLHIIDFPIELGYNPLEVNPLNGDLTISGAITNAASHYLDVYSSSGKTLRVTSTFSGTGGMSIKNGAKVIFSGTNKTYTGTTSIDNGELETSVGMASSTITVKSGTTLKINGTISIESVVIKLGGTLEILAGATLTINGDFENDGSFIHNNRNVIFAGSSVQTISGSTSTEFATLEINNSNGVNLAQTSSITTQLTLTSGKLTLGNNNLTLNAGATLSVSAPGSNKMIVTDNSGSLNINNASGTILFPIGNTSYTPVSITSGTAEDFSARVIGASPSGTSDPTKVVKLQWELTRSSSGSVDLKFQWNTSEHTASFNPAGIVVIGHNSGSGWDETLATVSGSSPYTATASFSSFSSFAIGNKNALPVELINFKATLTKEIAKLYWQTAAEINNSHFDIQRSSNSKTWENIGKVEGQGNSFQFHDYAFIDERPLNAANYYRLRQVDFDGKFNYSPIIILNNKTSQFNIYPNPVKDYFEINLSNSHNKKHHVQLINAMGQVIINEVTSQTHLTIETHKLQTGFYLVRISDDAGNMLFTEQINKL